MRSGKILPRIAQWIAAAALVFSFAFMPLKANALIPPLLGFSGYSVFTLPCTCSVSLWGIFAPLWLTSVTPIVAPMVYAPWATFPFPYFLFTVPLTPHIGAFIPAVQACWEYAVFFCFPLPSIGLMAFAGTGVPGAK